ncbi:MAG: CYTH domain-containing protein [bacterium]
MARNDREIERKYLLSGLPVGIGRHPVVEIDQGYLAGENVRERVRRIREADSVRYVRTVKVGTGMNRFEFEEDASEEFFAAVWPLTLGHRVHKRRYLVPEGRVVWEVDEFLDRELVIAEIELDTEDERIQMPALITSVLVREVTTEPEFSNYRLSR